MSKTKPDHGLYHFDSVRHSEIIDIWHKKFGLGPFLVVKKYTRRGYAKCNVRNIQTGKEYHGWGLPEAWGILDPFLTAAYEATQCK